MPPQSREELEAELQETRDALAERVNAVEKLKEDFAEQTRNINELRQSIAKYEATLWDRGDEIDELKDAIKTHHETIDRYRKSTDSLKTDLEAGVKAIQRLTREEQDHHRTIENNVEEIRNLRAKLNIQTKQQLRPELSAFAIEMESVLSAGDLVSGDSWKTLPMQELRGLLYGKWNKYNNHPKAPNNIEREELVDLANLSMMLWTRLRSQACSSCSLGPCKISECCEVLREIRKKQEG